MPLWIIVASTMLLLSSCTLWRDEYLEEVTATRSTSLLIAYALSAALKLAGMIPN